MLEMHNFLHIENCRNEAGIETARKFSWQNTAREMIKCLEN
jgi:hypothetical protein